MAVGGSVEAIRGGSPVDVTIDATGRVDTASAAQHARDATVFVDQVGAFRTGTLVSPRVVLTAAHCVRVHPVERVWIGARNVVGNYGDVTPGAECAPLDGPGYPDCLMGDRCLPDCVSVEIARCEVHPDRDGFCGDGFSLGDPGPSVLNDVALLVLSERFEDTRASRYPVIPAHVVENDPNNALGVQDPQGWLHHEVRFSGFGRRGLADESFHRMRLYAGSTVSAVYVPQGEFWAYDFGTIPGSVAFAGDSGCGVFVDPVDDGSPLQMLGVFHSGDGSSNYVARLTAPNHQAFLGDYLGPKDSGYPGAMVRVSSAVEVWTGPPDLPGVGELGYAGWRDPETGQAAAELDPDGDGLVGRHDLCWGYHNPRQLVSDVSYTTTCYAVSTRQTIEYGCAPRPAPFPEGELGVEGSNDNDNDGIPNACDNCPDVVNGDQHDCDVDSVPGVGGGDACAPDADHDTIPDACDNCNPMDCTGCSSFNPSQRDRDHDGLGDACEPDTDGDTVPDDSDNCPLVANFDQADCNHDAIQQWNRDAPSRGLPTREDLGDACDPDPCGDTRVVERHATRGATTTITYDQVEVDPVAVRTPALRAYDGFRFCPCDEAEVDSFFTRDRCRETRGCTVNDIAAYNLTEERAPWGWMSVSGPGVAGSRLDGTPGGEVLLDHAPTTSGFEPTFVGSWNLYGGAGSDASRYATLFPSPPGGSPTVVYTGVVWTHTPGTIASRFDQQTRERTSHYYGDAFPRPLTFSGPPPGADCFDGFAPFAGAFDWHGRIPFLGRDCGSASLPIGFRVGQVFLPPIPETDLPDLDLFDNPADWVPVSEPSGLLPDDGLRYVALDPLGGLLGVVEQRGKLFVPRGSQCPNCPPCPNCDPIGPLAMARGLVPEGELETIPVLSALRETLWLLESGGDAPSRLLTRHLDEDSAREPRALPGVGRILAAVYSPREDVIWLVDEQIAHTPRPHRAARFLAVQPDTGRTTVLATWAWVTSNDRFAMALEPSGAVYLVAGIARSRAHAVVRLEPSLRRGDVRVMGARVGVGAPVPGMARANRAQLAILVEGPGVPTQRSVDYATSSFRSGGIESCL